ncbi:hypothetical protein [Fluoribacter dumoffii]|uniref:hypothetical protein n=1 Tax=Fluoribacter dumoffii TaxID=463 RepID=UPI00026C77CF|nr:hypothetical protein [Fluoribacter dumoffii]
MTNLAPIETMESSQETEKDLLFARKNNSMFFSDSSEDKTLKVLETNLKFSKRNPSSSPNSNGIQVLDSMKATIYEVSKDSLKLKINEDTFLDIPKSVFPDKENILKYGQNVVYSIKMREDGSRFQDIEIERNTPENPYKEKVLNILNNIKFKDEN